MSFTALPVALALAKRETRSFHLAAGETAEIRVATGTCWITLEGDSEDYVVTPAESLLLRGPGLVVVEGLHPANALLAMYLPASQARKDRGETLPAIRLLSRC